MLRTGGVLVLTQAGMPGGMRRDDRESPFEGSAFPRRCPRHCTCVETGHGWDEARHLGERFPSRAVSGRCPRGGGRPKDDDDMGLWYGRDARDA